MNVPATCTLLIMLCSALPSFSQSADANVNNTGSNTAVTSSTDANAPEDLSAFREEIARKNKALGDKVATEKAIVKKNAIIIQDAKKIDAANKRLENERKMLDAQNAVFEKERRAMMPDATDTPAEPSPSHTTSTPMQSNPAPAVRMESASSPAPSAAPVMVNYSANKPAVNAPAAAAAAVPASVATATVVAAPAAPLRLSEGTSMSMLLTPIKPVYPQIAQTTHTEGSVVLDAVISKSGTIESLHPVSGPDVLRRAAMDAVQVARYQPYRVNGEATPVETTITVVFRMRS